MLLPLSVCLSVGQLEKLSANFDEIFSGEVRCLTSVGDPNADPGMLFLKEVSPLQNTDFARRCR